MDKTNLNVVRQLAEFIPFNPVIYTRLAMVNRSFYTVFTSDAVWRRYDFDEVKTNIFKNFLIKSRGLEKLMILSWYEGFRDPCISNLFTDIADQVEQSDNKYLKFGFVLNNFHPIAVADPYYFNEPMYLAFMDLTINRRDAVARLMPESVMGTLNGANNILYHNCPIKTQSGHPCPHRLVKTCVPGFCATHEQLMVCFHSLVMHPRVIQYVYWNLSHEESYVHQIAAILKDLEVDRSALLSFIEGMPEFLDAMPQYWNDREFCLSALKNIPLVAKDVFHTSFNFLTDCKDPVVIVEALETLEFSEVSFSPKCLLQDKSLFLRALRAVTPDICDVFLDCDEFSDSPWWKDPAALATLTDNAHFKPHEGASIPTPIQACSLLESLTDNYAWMLQRVQAQPSIWFIASPRLQRQRGLLLRALSSMAESRKPTCVPIESKYAKVFEFGLPEIYFADEEVVKQSVMAVGLASIPKKKWTEELVQCHVKAGHNCDGLFAQNNTRYKWVRAAVLANLRTLENCPWALPAFAGDPTISPYLCERIHDVYFIIVCRANREILFRRAFNTLVRSTTQMKKTMDPVTAARVLELGIDQYRTCNLPLGIDVALEFIKRLGDRSLLTEGSTPLPDGSFRDPSLF